MRVIISSNAAAVVFPIFQYQSGQNLLQSHGVMSLRILPMSSRNGMKEGTAACFSG